ncbi:MAG: cation:proton antiporter [Chloroflexota bacterium]
MNEHQLLSLAAVIVLGITAQWIAWRFRIPAILLLLVFGFLAGPIFGLIQPDQLFGKTLFPLVSLAVAIILFEGGLSLKISELRESGGIINRIILIGAPVAWVLASIAAYYLLHLGLEMSLLLGAILVVSGPTVVIPLLNHVRPTSRVASVLKWEGILIDPVGATLAVLVFETILAEEELGLLTLSDIFQGIFMTLLIGSIVGAIGAAILVWVFQHRWVPHHLDTALALMMVLAAFAVSDFILPESGLMAVTLMGVILANQSRVSVKHIVAFKEELGILLLSSLFIVLAGRLQLAQLAHLGWGAIIFLLVLLLVVRPLSAFLATVGSGFSWRERIFLAWMAPRGIVAASVASLFALELEERGYHGAEELVPLTFLVVVGTVAIYGLTVKPLATWLQLRQKDPQGVLMMGAHPWARQVAEKLQDIGFEVILVDTNQSNVLAARMAGLTAVAGSILDEDVLEKLPLERVGYFLALTSNNELNALAAIRLKESIGSRVYQLAFSRQEKEEKLRREMRGEILFDRKLDAELLDFCFDQGAELRHTRLTDKFTFADYQQEYGETAVPLFLINADSHLVVCTTREAVSPRAGDTIVSMVAPAGRNYLGEQIELAGG